MLDNKTLIIGYSGHAYVLAESYITNGGSISFYADLKEAPNNPFNLEYLGFESDANFKGWDMTLNYILGIGDNNSSSGENFKTKMKTYPNPTNNSTTLSFNLAKSGSVTAQVYSITGRLIKTVVDQNRPAGENTLFIDGDDIPNGTYIIKFVSGKQVESVKFIKM